MIASCSAEHAKDRWLRHGANEDVLEWSGGGIIAHTEITASLEHVCEH